MYLYLRAHIHLYIDVYMFLLSIEAQCLASGRVYEHRVTGRGGEDVNMGRGTDFVVTAMLRCKPQLLS